ncbi:MAG: N-6 DNA methylase [bacterium]|nr:N-6 DNA methylase [bacterium]
MTEKQPQYILDYISGEQIKVGPEEIEAVQVFSRRLVEDYGYNKGQIQTRPQFRIKESPSGRDKYPIDIAVFHNNRHTYDNLYMIVECKRKLRRTGVDQLKLYMSLSSAQIGVWFNGNEHVYLQKILDKQGNVTFRELPNIPKLNQRIEDIGKYTRKDLKPPVDLKAIFRDIRNHLAGMTTGITRDETLAQEIINLLFCKIYDEINTPLNEYVTFRAGVDESPAEVKKRIVKLFEQQVKREYEDVFDSQDIISLDEDSIVYVVGELQNYLISQADRDAIGDAFEVFIGPALRGPEGQFFTPRNVVKMMVEILDPKPGEMIIDPACGSGGFLIAALEHVWRKLDADAQAFGWTEEFLGRRKREVASRYFRGIDKDSFLAKVTKAYMAIIGDGRGGVFCENSLLPSDDWENKVQSSIQLDTFDLVLSNPPFGSKIAVKGEHILRQYDLAKKWDYDKAIQMWNSASKLKPKQSPQLLFIERCLQLLKPGGRMGIILPESIFGNPSHGYIVQYLKQNAKVIGLISMPEELFQPYTHAKTCVAIVEKLPPDDEREIYMGIVKWCGHDSRGNKIPYDDVPRIAESYTRLMIEGDRNFDRFGFLMSAQQLKGNILIPKYYDPDIAAALAQLQETHDLITIGDLVRDGVLRITTGDEVGKLAYGTGPIPFIRTSDITNWELKTDPKHSVSMEIYERLRQKQSVQAQDILMVRDGTYLIGTSCMLTEYDTQILFQSHIYKLRVIDQSRLSPYLLLAVLNSPIVKRQIRAKQFTQDIIDTLGGRIHEIVLPLPRSETTRANIVEETCEIVEGRAKLRQRVKEITEEVARTADYSSDLIE